jgi:hypothetical protein
MIENSKKRSDRMTETDEQKEVVILGIGIFVGSAIGTGLLLLPIIVIPMFVDVNGIDLIGIWLLWIFLLGGICMYYEIRNIRKEERASFSYVVGKMLTGGF